MNVFFMIAMAMFVVAAVLLLIGARQFKDSLIGFACLAFFVGFGFCSMGILYHMEQKTEEIKTESITRFEQLYQEAITLEEYGGYEAYVNGVLVDLENVELEQYIVTIDHEKKKILLTR